MSSIIYLSISKHPDRLILEHSSIPGNFSEVSSRIARTLLSKGNASAGSRHSFSHENFLFHVVVDCNNLAFVAMTPGSIPASSAFSFLSSISAQFVAVFPDAIPQKFNQKHTFNPTRLHAFSGTIAHQIKEHSAKHFNDPGLQKIERLKGKLDEVKDVMLQNIDRVIERGEKLDTLVDKTELMANTASSFRAKATQLKRRMWWHNARIILLVLFTISVCEFNSNF